MVKIEKVCWKNTRNRKQLRMCVIGFVLEENENGLIVYSTKGISGPLDKVAILKKNILSRTEFY